MKFGFQQIKDSRSYDGISNNNKVSTDSI